MAQLSQDGRKPSQSIDVAVESAGPIVAARLGLDIGDPVAVRKRVRSLDGEPFNINDTYYDFKLAGDTAIMNPADIPQGSNFVMESKGLVEVRAIDEIYIRMPNSEEVSRLNLGAGTPVAMHVATGYTADDRPVRCDIFIIPGDRHVILFERIHNRQDAPAATS